MASRDSSLHSRRPSRCASLLDDAMASALRTFFRAFSSAAPRGTVPMVPMSLPSQAAAGAHAARARLSYAGMPTMTLRLPSTGANSLLAAHAPATRSWHPPYKGVRFAVPAVPDCHFRSRRQFSSADARRFGPSRPSPQPSTGLDTDWEKWDTATKLAVIALVGGTAYYLTHLEQVPETGRWRFMSVNPKAEAQIAEQEQASLQEEYKGRILPSNHPVVQQIRRIVSAILEANNLGVVKGEYPAYTGPGPGSEDMWDPDSERTGYRESDGSDTHTNTREWNLIVVHDEKVVNAAASHGTIIVFTGILPVARDEQGLAAVLSHEIAHVVARHVSEKLSSMLVFKFVVNVLGVLGLDPGFGSLLMEYLYSLPNSRTQELEADKIGLQLAARACFDPRGAPAMQARLLDLERRQGSRRLNVSFLYTHPTGDQRIKLLTDALPEAYTLRASSGACAHLQDDFDAFREAADRVREGQERVLR
ncbi:hypothetical protein M0805_007644 [Coniferiporia weirii]|nr:hypothetical protein M0805_007644 [Coniferiporia weirii]